MDNLSNSSRATRGLCFWTEKMPLQGAAAFLTQKLKNLPNITPLFRCLCLRSLPTEEQTENYALATGFEKKRLIMGL